MTKPCKNCKQATSPHYIRKYGGYCLGCFNAGVPELKDELEQLKKQLDKAKLENEMLRQTVADLHITLDVMSFPY